MDSHDTSPPMPPSQTPSQQPVPMSGLAIGSLITGILGIAPVAIVLGHMARSQIKKAEGQMQGGVLALVGLILGYATLILLVGIMVMAILAAIMVPAIAKTSDRAQEMKTLNTARNLELSLENYYLEYNKYPYTSETGAIRSDETLMNVLLAADSETGKDGLNPRAIVFFSGTEATHRPDGTYRDGLVSYDSGGGELVDHWGNPYYLLIDSNGDYAITIPEGEEFPRSGTTIPVSAAIWSAGPDGLSGTEDDIADWIERGEE